MVAQATTVKDHGPKPTIVLVHGAWADASSWNPVISRLQQDGYTVAAPPNPLRGVDHDAQTLKNYLATIKGPVVLVGHSYGGMVITNAAAGNPNVKALVYDNAYIPAQGETVFEINAAKPGSCVTADPSAFLNLVPYPGSPQGDFDAYLKVEANGVYQGFADCFANGVPRDQARLLAALPAPLRGQRRIRALRYARVEDHPVLGGGRYRRPRHPFGRAAGHGHPREGSHHQGQRRSPVPDHPARRGDRRHPRRRPSGRPLLTQSRIADGAAPIRVREEPDSDETGPGSSRIPPRRSG